MRLNTNKFIKELRNRLTDINTGSYIADGCGEDYFDDVLNLYEIVNNSINYCTQFNNEEITYTELLNKLSGIRTEWDAFPFEGFYSFKSDEESLGETLFDFDDFLKEFLNERIKEELC